MFRSRLDISLSSQTHSRYSVGRKENNRETTSKVHPVSDGKLPDYQLYNYGFNVEDVAIKVRNIPADTIEYKSLSSFLRSVQKHEGPILGSDVLQWLADLTTRRITPATRKRYLMKFRSVTGFEASKAPDLTTEPDGVGKLKISIKKLLSHPGPDCLIPIAAEKVQQHLPRLAFTNVDSTIHHLFLYLLIEPRKELGEALMLTVDDPSLEEMRKSVPWMASILTPTHHRRRYLFNYGQSRKRLPQLIREATQGLTDLLTELGIPRVSNPRQLIRDIWINRALSLNIPPIGPLTPSYSYLSVLFNTSSLIPHPSDLNQVASSFSTDTPRWHVMRMRRGTTIDLLRHQLKDAGLNVDEDYTLFYPTYRRPRKVNKKIHFDELAYLPGVLFFRATDSRMPVIASAIGAYAWIYRQTARKDSSWSIVSDKEMAIFQRAVHVTDGSLNVELTDKPPLHPGQRVRITGGPLSGHEGLIHKLSKETGADTADDTRLFSIRLTANTYMTWTVAIEDCFLQPL